MKLTRRKLDRLPRESIHKARNWSKADVSIAQWPPKSGNRVVIKDLRARPLWFRVLAGRYFLWREWRALCALRDFREVPDPVARPLADVIVMGFKNGRQVETIEPWEMPDGAARKIEAFVEKMHKRGVTHGDLHGYNILVDDEGEIALIDWATASVFGKNPQAAKKFAFEEWKALDERALAKVKIIHDPIEITERERDLLLNGGSRIYRAVKNIRTKFEKLRGMDEAKLAARAQKQDRYLKRLNRYYNPGDEETKRALEEKLKANKLANKISQSAKTQAD